MAKKKPKNTLFNLPKLKQLRLDLGLTKEELKTKAGLSRATIAKAEDDDDGYVSESSMAKLLKALNGGGLKLSFADTLKKLGKGESDDKKKEE